MVVDLTERRSIKSLKKNALGKFGLKCVRMKQKIDGDYYWRMQFINVNEVMSSDKMISICDIPS